MKKLLITFLALCALLTANALNTPTPTSPTNGASLSTVSPQLNWSSVSGVSGYQWQCDISSNFDSPQLVSGTRTSSYNYVSVSNLRYGALYYWRVRCYSGTDTSAWSTVSKFYTPSTLTLSTPANGATISGVNTTLYWNTITGSSRYYYRCDTTPNFNSGALKTGYVTSSYDYVSISNLYYGKTYYWQIYALNSVDTTCWSTVWHFNTNPGPVTLSSPANNATISGVNTTLYWNTISGSSRYLYECDTTPSFNSSVRKSGYVTSSYDYVSISNLYYGKTYYWRIRALNSVDTTDWSAVWKFNTNAGNLTLSSPANGATISGVSTTLYWHTITGSNRYYYRCDTTPNFNSAAMKSGNVSSSYDYASISNLYYGTTYYWQVRAVTSTDTTDWSAIWNFTTASGPVTLSSPANNATISGVSTTLYWNTITGSSRYLYECDTTPNFNSAAMKSGNVSSSYDYASISNLYYGTTYYWRVRALNSVDTTDWSTVWTFHTNAGNLTLSSPANGATISGVNTTLYWHTITGSSRYYYRCDTTPNFNSGALKTGYVTSSYDYVSISNLYYGKTYYWQIYALNSVDTTCWSTVWHFNTNPGPVTLSSPANNATISGVNTTLYWNTISGSSRYLYECDTTPSFNSSVRKSGYVSSSYDYVSISNLYYGKTYYWRIRALNSVDTTDWSAVWKFNTNAGNLTLSSPANGATISGVNTTLYWHTITGSSRYYYRCDTTPNFNSGALKTGYVTSSYDYVSISNLYYGKTYYWQVYAANSVDTTDWSAVWTFTTANRVNLSSPANGSTLSSTNTTIYWNTLSGSNGYRYEVDVLPTFNTPYKITGTTTSSYNYKSINNLNYNTTYYWRVCAYNNSDTSDWSQVWTFNTNSLNMTTAPTLISPVNGSTAIPNDGQAFTWNSLPNAMEYQIEYATDASFTYNVGYQQINQTSVLLYGLLSNTTYYWRVRGINGVDFSPWSTVWHFTTANCSVSEQIQVTTCDEYVWGEMTLQQSGTYTQAFTSENGCDSIVTLDLTLHFTQYSDDYATICVGQLPYPYLDTTFGTGTISGDYDVITTSQNGCDSIVTLHLTVVTAFNSAMEATSCGDFLWNGISYNQSGIYTQSFTNQYGCDSIVTLNLTISDVLYDTIAVDACGSYEWNGTTYTQSGTYTETLTSVAGCDSVATLQLTVHQSIDTTISVTTCDSYLWNDQLYNTSGIYQQHFSTETGCDSTVTLHLTINEPVTAFDTLHACDQYEWHGTTFTASGNYTWNGQTSGGCDSIVQLCLIIHNSVIASETIVAEGSYEWNGTLYTESGDYTWTGQTADGCDSIVTLHLSITTGIRSNEAASFKVYPNPAKSVWNVYCDVWTEDTEIQIFDTYGRKLRTQPVQGESTRIDISGFAPGAYILEIVKQQRPVFSTKAFIIR